MEKYNLKSYTLVPVYGLVCEDGWVQALDTPRTKMEKEIASLPICPQCGDPKFNLMYILSITHFCEC